ncbi:thymidylate kinase [Spirochaetia bacterium]|nr:thymidylate kinase [Spirochaetia bacterium]
MAIIHNFAVLEGGDGTGTSTQLDLLRQRFSRPGLPPFYPTFEPTDSPIGKIIRSALKGDPPLQSETSARLFAADRNEHLYGKGGITERCGRGELVVSDRYVLSSLVYQGLDCGEALSKQLNAAFPGPELLLFFDLDPEIAQKRLAGRAERDHYEYLEFQIKVRERYKALLPEYEKRGVRVETINASRTPPEVAEQVWSALKKMPIFEG